MLNFNGRVTMASVKNFQLVQPEEQDAIILQFGRVGKDEFTMDFQWRAAASEAAPKPPPGSCPSTENTTPCAGP